MKIQWNDKVLDTDTAVANKDGSFTWQYTSHWMTYYPDKEFMLCGMTQDGTCVVPIIYRRKKSNDTLPNPTTDHGTLNQDRQLP